MPCEHRAVHHALRAISASVPAALLASEWKRNPLLAWAAVLCVCLLRGATPSPAAGDLPPVVPRFSVNYIDRAVVPGQDFYQFAVGGWAARAVIPPGRSRWGALDELQERNRFLIRTILEECRLATNALSGSPTRLVGDFYASAMDHSRRNRLGWSPIAPDLEKLSRAKDFSALLRWIAELHLRDVNPLFTAVVIPDARRGGVQVLQIAQGGLSLPGREYYVGEAGRRERDALRAHMIRLLEIAGDSGGVAEAEAEAALSFERRLAQISRSREQLIDPEGNYHPFTPEQLAAFAPNVPWRDYWEACGLGRLDRILVAQTEFVRGLSGLVSAIPIAEWKSYLRWHLISASAPYLSTAAEAESMAFRSGEVPTAAARGRPEVDWQGAAQAVNHRLGDALGRLYVERYVPVAVQARVAAMADNVRTVLADRIRSVPWMQSGTRSRALVKLSQLRVKVGYPERFRDYGGLGVRRDDYLGNVWRAARLEVRRQLDRLGQPVDRAEWGIPPQALNPGYVPGRNELVLPAGFLQPPFFDAEMDDAVNYGALGTILAHELVHAVDNLGRWFGPDGAPGDWWGAEDFKAFAGLAQRVVDQYSAFEVLPGVRLDGRVSVDENLADLEGVRVAFAAWQRVAGKLADGTARIDGFTSAQRFFLAWAQACRGSLREEALRRVAVTGPLAPPRFRANGPLMNSPEFLEAFDVQPGALMWRAPADRIRIW